MPRFLTIRVDLLCIIACMLLIRAGCGFVDAQNIARPANFENCLWDGARWYAGTQGNSIWFTDPWRSRMEDMQYDWQAYSKFTQLPFTDVVQEAPAAYTFYTSAVANSECSASVTTTFQRQQSIATSFAVTNTQTLSMATSYEMSVSIDGIGAKASASITVGVSSSETHTTTTTNTYSVQVAIPTPPSTYEQIEWAANTRAFSLKAPYVVDFSGWVAVWFNNKIDLWTFDGQNLHWLWFLPVWQVLDWGQQSGSRYCDGFQASGSGAQFNSYFNVKGNYGLEAELKLYPYKIQCVDPVVSGHSIAMVVASSADDVTVDLMATAAADGDVVTVASTPLDPNLFPNGTVHGMNRTIHTSGPIRVSACKAPRRRNNTFGVPPKEKVAKLRHAEPELQMRMRRKLLSVDNIPLVALMEGIIIKDMPTLDLIKSALAREGCNGLLAKKMARGAASIQNANILSKYKAVGNPLLKAKKCSPM